MAKGPHFIVRGVFRPIAPPHAAGAVGARNWGLDLRLLSQARQGHVAEQIL